jgi:ArsR family transcriptional regulator, arsenate/arsenite/antimonite-responsive transcriptional repressor
METKSAVVALSALAHEGRLQVFRLLVQAGTRGMAAGDIARAAGVAPSSLSSNLAILSAAGLASSRRDGRSIIYTAAYDRMRELLGFLVEDCCRGEPQVCAPLAAVVSRACQAEGGNC